MAQSALECANRALYKMGSVVVTAIDGTDTSKEALAMQANIDLVKKALLRDYPWNFAVKRKVITPPASFAVSNVTWVSSTLVEVTHASVTYALGSYVTLAGVVGATLANGTFEVQTATVGGVTTRITVPLATTSALLGTYVADTGDLIRQSPAYEYSYLYTLPTDCLRVITVNDEVVSDEWRIEGGSILTDDDTSIEIRYVKDVTDYTTMDVAFYECLAVYLAWELCDHITGDDAKKRALYTDLHGGDGKPGLLPKAKFIDAAEDSIARVQGDDWLSARFGGAGGYEPVSVTTEAL